MNRTDRLSLAHLWVAIIAFGIAAAMAFMQALSRASLDSPRLTVSSVIPR